MTKVGKLWSWLAGRARASGSSKSIGPSCRDIPPIPAPKTHKKSRYSIVVISESGVSRQIELTRFRLRLAFAVAAGVVAVLIVAFLTVRSAAPVDKSLIAERDALSDKVRALEERLQKQELELTVRKNRLHEMEESLAKAVTEQPPASLGDGRISREGPLTSIPEQIETSRTAPPFPETKEEAVEHAPAAAGRSRAPEPRPSPPTRPVEETERASTGPSPIAFNAQDVTAAAEGPNRVKLSFRLVKDQPKVRFSGYLFAVVEMKDARGESRIIAYPNRTKLGDEDLPQDYLAGEKLAFKLNQKVELTYEDKRASAALSRVTIVLYNEDGNIVFQRGFDRSELKLVSTPATRTEALHPAVPRPEKKRQAL
ncbi:MAG: hypothetical protein LDL33_11380 [Desulfomonile sp.]|nr:hypothetical protein [Desulfomonile sp.]